MQQSSLAVFHQSQKKIDVPQQVRASLHVFNHVTEALIQGQNPSGLLQDISLDKLQKAKPFREHRHAKGNC